jgi:hypothetical protein
MGDKSPKSNQKKAGQKKRHDAEVKRKKQAADDAKHVLPTKPGQK